VQGETICLLNIKAAELKIMGGQAVNLIDICGRTSATKQTFGLHHKSEASAARNTDE
jgi:hypothetical protein